MIPGRQRSVKANSIHVEDADSLVVLLGAARISCRTAARTARSHAARKCNRQPRCSREAQLGRLVGEHERDYRNLFDRVALDLGRVPSALPTDQRLAAYGSSKPDRGLEELLFQYGRT